MADDKEKEKLYEIELAKAKEKERETNKLRDFDCKSFECRLMNNFIFLYY